MPFFVKKRIEVEALQYTGDNYSEIKAWMAGYGAYNIRQAEANPLDDLGMLPRELVLGTLTGPMRVAPGEWILRRPDGSFYPCDPFAFKADFEPRDK